MNRLEKILSKWNFKKIAVWYIVVAVIAGIACVGTLGYLYRERLNFAWQYSRLEKAKAGGALETAADKIAAASADVTDVFILDENNRVLYSAKKTGLADGISKLKRVENEKKYLTSEDIPDTVFRYVNSKEFMLNSVINKDFGEIRSDFDDDSAFENALTAKSVYMLSAVKIHGGGKVYVVTVPTSVPGGMTAIKAYAALAMLFFCLYWVLVALWLYKDAAGAKLSPIYWGLIGLFTNIIGLIVYKIYKRSMAVCISCGAAQNVGHLYCSFCGAELGKRCSSCGCKVGSKDAFCAHCGNKIK